MIQRCWWIGVLIGCVTFAQEKDLKKDLKSALVYYASLGDFKMELMVKMVPTQGKPTDFNKMVVLQKKGQVYFYQYEHSDMLLDSSLVLIINKNSKTFYLQEVDADKMKIILSQKNLFASLDTVNLKFQSVKFQQVDVDTKKYQLFFKENDMIKLSEIYFKVGNPGFYKIIHYYNPTQMPQVRAIEVKYVMSDSKVALMNRWDYYLTFENGIAKPTARFANYQVETIKDFDRTIKEDIKF